MAIPSLQRLQATLLTSGLQQKDQPLYQVISQLISALQQIANTVSSGGSGGGGGSVVNIFNNQTIMSLLGDNSDDNNDMMVIPGPAGTNGTGSGSAVPYYIAPTETFIVPIFKQALFAMNIDNEGILEVDGFLIEVDRYGSGTITIGATGPVFIPDDYHDELITIPGPVGPAGPIGPMGIPSFMEDINPYNEDWLIGLGNGLINLRSGATRALIFGNGIIASQLKSNVFPGNPTGTVSITDVMMGLAVAFTPQQGGSVMIIATMNAANTVLGDGITCTIYGGTGVAPVNGAALTGTQLSGSKTFTAPVAGGNTELVLVNMSASLPAGVASWLDIAVHAVTGGTASISSISFHMMEN